MKQRPSLLTLLHSKRKGVYAFLSITIFLVLAVVIPLVLKRRSSKASKAQIGNNVIYANDSNDGTQMPTDLTEMSPTGTPTAFLPWDDDAVSNSGDAANYLRQSESSGGSAAQPSTKPSPIPSASPTLLPSSYPSVAPTQQHNEPSSSPSLGVTFIPGLLTHEEHGLLLSQGLKARPLAVSGQRVPYHNGDSSSIPFHSLPDFGAAFEDIRPENPGGWVYLSNSEMEDAGAGGVGGLTFDSSGNVIDYKMLLTNTQMNCGGGKTPWNTWISCEETDGGRIYQVDPMGVRSSEKITLGHEGGHFESFAYRQFSDLTRAPEFFVTEDAPRGALQRFIPTEIYSNDPWSMLHGTGITHYLELYPNSDESGGTFSWGTDRSSARENAERYYPNSEGIDVSGSMLFFVCKKVKQLFSLDLDNMSYTRTSTVSGLFDGTPDQMKRILSDNDDGNDLLFFTEEGGKDPGIHGRDETGMFFTILESPVYEDETTGLSFSPNGKFMYIAYQKTGILYEISRIDGLPFHAKSLNVKYHNDQLF